MKAAKSSWTTVNRYAVKKYHFVFPTIYELVIFNSHEKFTVYLMFFQMYLRCLSHDGNGDVGLNILWNG